MLSIEHPIKQELLHTVQNLMQQLQDIRGAVRGIPKQETTYIEKIAVEKIEMGTGCYGTDPICRKILL